jgi:hypothetical protein
MAPVSEEGYSKFTSLATSLKSLETYTADFAAKTEHDASQHAVRQILSTVSSPMNELIFPLYKSKSQAGSIVLESLSSSLRSGCEKASDILGFHDETRKSYTDLGKGYKELAEMQTN